jgi:biopolymer transport protein ExbD
MPTPRSKPSNPSRHEPPSDPELDLSSLIDISFLLLIFFLVSSTLLKRETDLGLDLSGEGRPIDPPVPLAIDIAGDGSITVGGQQMGGASQPGEPGQIDEVREQLLEFRKRAELVGETAQVSLSAAGEADTQRFIDVINALSYAGIDHIALNDAIAAN